MNPNVPLGTLLEGLGGRPSGAWEGRRVRGIATDSRRVEAGDLFVALGGEHTHGARFIQEALHRGAVGVVSDPSATALLEGVPGLLHNDPLSILPRLALRLYGDPASHLTIHGVTGTNGKTTTALLIATILEASGIKVAHWTTTDVSSGGRHFRPKWTTPHAHDIQRFFYEAHHEGAEHAVLEVSSHGVAQGRITGIPFATGVVTNVTPDHLDFHGDFAHYVAVKESFVRSLPPTSFAVLNADDPVTRTFARSTRAEVILSGVGPDADVTARDVVLTPTDAHFKVVVRRDGLGAPAGSAFPVRLPLVGRHNISNALMAFAASLSAGADPHEASRALATTPPPPRRLERQTIGPYTILNDVAMNEASYDTVLATVAELGFRSHVIVHAVRGQRGTDVNARIVRILARWDETLHFAPLITSLSRDTLAASPVDQTVGDDELEAVLSEAERCHLAVHLHDELREAITEAVSRLEPGGLLVLLGTFGMDDGPAMAAEALARRLGRRNVKGIRYQSQEDAPPRRP